MPYLFEEDLPGEEIGFDVRVPDNWTRYDLSGDALADMRAQAAARFGERSAEMDVLNDVFADMTTSLRDTTDSGLLSAAGVMEEYDDGFLLANMCVFAFTAPPGQDMDPLKLVEHVYTSAATDRPGAWLEKTVVSLPESGADLCGRIYGVADYDVGDIATVRTVAMHTAFRAPGVDKRILVSCSSPNVDQTADVLDLFDAITGTAWFWRREYLPPGSAPSGG
ncbi:hypothetical protein [Nocardiopsis halotolerans]|uniref:hypothetical protein n=1 Tax=Nocardiopsis halotolerans TaxID=124252 RepID=UPI0003479F95|nr:hypothetical protein [Nocardiopsis halotolerans]